MIFLYCFIITIASIPFWITLRYILLEEKIRKEGITTSGVVTHIHTMKRFKGPTTDRVHTQYQSIVPTQYHQANFETKHRRYSVGQQIPVKYLPEKPGKIIVEVKRGYVPMLIFTIIILLFSIFAVYKIDEMVKNEYRNTGYLPGTTNQS